MRHDGIFKNEFYYGNFRSLFTYFTGYFWFTKNSFNIPDARVL